MIDVLTSTDGSGALDVALDPTDPNPQEFEWENDTGLIINSLDFEAIIQTGLSMSSITANFQCATLDQNGNPVLGFFQSCTVGYDSATGVLSYLFAGTMAPFPDTGENVNHDDWDNEQAGIPSCPAGLAPTECDINNPSDPLNDFDRGLFTLEFAGFQTNPDYVGGASGPPPTFMGSYTVQTPEPSYVILLVSGLFLLWFVRRRKVAQ
jgi:hypothetical protein